MCLVTPDYEPLPALPPCLTQSLQHTQLTRRQSEPLGANSTPPRRQISLQPGTKSSSSQGLPFVPKQVQGLYNIRTFDLRIFELQQQQQQQRRQSQRVVSVTNPSFDGSDSTTTASGNTQQPPPAPSSTHTRSVTPENPHSPTKTSAAASSSSSHKLSQTYPGSPISSLGQERGDGVAGGAGGGGGGVRRGGGLQAVVTRYQENRRRSSKGSPLRRTSGDFGNVRFTSAEFGGPSSSSAGMYGRIAEPSQVHLLRANVTVDRAPLNCSTWIQIVSWI